MAGMTADQAIKEVQQIAGFRTDKADLILLMLGYFQSEREKPGMTFPPWLRKTNDSAIVTTKNISIYNIPSDYIQDTEELEGNLYLYTGGLGVQQSRTIFLKKQNFEGFQKRYFGEWPYVYANPPQALADQSDTIQPGAPIDYVLRDTDVILGPTPDNTYNISWRYWAQDIQPALGQTNKWLTNAPWCLIGDAALKLCSDLKYADGISQATQIKELADANLFRSVINRQEAGKRRRM